MLGSEIHYDYARLGAVLYNSHCSIVVIFMAVVKSCGGWCLSGDQSPEDTLKLMVRIVDRFIWNIKRNYL